MNVRLLAYTPDPEYVVAAAAKTCYSQSAPEEIYNDLDDEAVDRFFGILNDAGHESPIEHASFTFSIEGISRSCLAQITRHRMASYSVKSQRYVSEKKFSYVVPPAISKDEEAAKIYDELMEEDRRVYNKLVDRLTELRLPEFERFDDAKTRAKKMAQEDARFVLPNSCDTQLIMTMNARSLLNFFKLRCCERAQWEIRSVANEMLRQVKIVAPHIFAKAGPPCVVDGRCHEGKMTCGKRISKE